MNNNINITIHGIEFLRPNHAGALQFKNGNTANYGVIELDGNQLTYFTGKGLREIWKPKMNEEERNIAMRLREIYNKENGIDLLMETGHVAKTPLDEIDQVLF